MAELPSSSPPAEASPPASAVHSTQPTPGSLTSVESGTISFTHFDDHTKTQGVRISATFEELAERFTKIEVSERREGSGFCPALFRGDYRNAKNVEAISMLVVDVDRTTEEEAERALSTVTQSGSAFIILNSYSHLLSKHGEPPGSRYRVIIPFNKPMPLAHHTLWRDWAWEKLMEHFGFKEIADKATRDAPRFFFDPRKPSEDSPHEAGARPGLLCDWEALLGDLSKVKIEKPAAITIEKPDPSRGVNFDDLRKRLRKGETVLGKKLANGKSLTSPPSKRRLGGLTRHEAWNKATYLLAIRANDWEDTRALIELCKGSHEAMTADGEDYRETLESITEMIESARLKMPEIRAEEARDEAARKTLQPLFKGLAKADDLEWAGELKRDHEERALANEATAIAVLRAHPNWKGRIKLNQITRYIEIDTRDHPAFPEKMPENFEDLHATYVNRWFQREALTQCRLSKDVLHDSIDLIADENKFNPILDLARSVPWDGKCRVETMGISLFNAMRIENGADLLEYQCEIWRVFMLSAMARLRFPGSKVDTVLVLEGGQGIGKSKALVALFGPRFCHTSGVHPDGGADSREPLSMNWGIILEEGASFKKSNGEAWKGFLTQTHDDFRYKFTRRTKKVARSCVFIATTNEREYLMDPTGNRRFLPSPIADGNIDTERIEASRQQIFAEALARIEDGEQWWTEDERLKQLIESVREIRTSADPLHEAIKHWYSNHPQRPRIISTIEVSEGIKENIDKGHLRFMGKALRDLGFKPNPVRGRAGDWRRTYIVPDAWLEMPKGAKACVVSLIPQQKPALLDPRVTLGTAGAP